MKLSARDCPVAFPFFITVNLAKKRMLYCLRQTHKGIVLLFIRRSRAIMKDAV